MTDDQIADVMGWVMARIRDDGPDSLFCRVRQLVTIAEQVGYERAIAEMRPRIDPAGSAD